MRFLGPEVHSHTGKKILVAGAGTLEALVVANQHPLAQSIVALDFSHHSLEILRQRVKWARFFRKLPPITFVHADIKDWEGESFDYVLASNLLHHSDQPSLLLKKLRSHLSDNGLLRVVTYPKQSRIWMRLAAQWFKLQGLSAHTPELYKKAKQTLTLLPATHPIRSCFESHPETHKKAGLIDSFFHALENPLGPLEWEKAFDDASLQLVGESQNKTSQSAFLTEIFPETGALPTWTKLQILDDLLELCANPILWAVKTKPYPKQSPLCSAFSRVEIQFDPDTTQIPSCIFREINEGLARVQTLLAGTPLALKDVLQTLKEKVGPRVNPLNPDKILPGLSLGEYPYFQLGIK